MVSRKQRQITRTEQGHILTNSHVWSLDSQWIVYDVRSDPAGSLFDGGSIERVHVGTGKVETLYRSQRGAKCGVVTYSPIAETVVFILGPELPTDDWQYAPYHRQGVLVDTQRPGVARRLDARNILPPFTPGALRGGSHVHVFDPSGQWVSYTYEDHVLATPPFHPDRDLNQRNIGISQLGHPVTVPDQHPRNHGGESFSFLVTTTHNRPKPGSDEIQKAYEECWFPSNEESPRTKRLVFLGDTLSEKEEVITELFSVAFPIDFHRDDPLLAGTIDRRPAVPQGTLQRRLTRTQSRRFPGVRGTRHWPQVRPDGTSIALLMLDDRGIAQLFLIDASDGSWHPLTKMPTPVSSAFTWSPDGRSVAFLSDRSVYLVDASSGHSERITSPATLEPRPEACVFSPDGSKIAYVAPVQGANDRSWNQIFVVELD